MMKTPQCCAAYGAAQGRSTSVKFASSVAAEWCDATVRCSTVPFNLRGVCECCCCPCSDDAVDRMVTVCPSLLALLVFEHCNVVCV